MRSRGFTLLETLVAVAILGLILAFYGGSLRLMLGAVARQANTVDTADDRAGTAQAVRRLLGALQPTPQLPNERPNQAPALQANPHSLRFVTILPGQPDPVDATIERDAAGRLMLLWSPRRHVRPLGAPPRPTATELATGIAALDFSYFHAGTWTASLPPGQSPTLIRVRLTPQKGRAGADLIAAPITDAPL